MAVVRWLALRSGGASRGRGVGRPVQQAPTSPLSIGPETGTRRGPQAPKTTQNFYKKARSAFLFTSSS